jgi:hypothetical protein
MKTLVSNLDLTEVLPVPMSLNESVYQKLVLGAHTLHDVLESVSIALDPVDSARDHQDKGVFHVATEFVDDDFLKTSHVLFLVALSDCADLAVRGEY